MKRLWLNESIALFCMLLHLSAYKSLCKSSFMPHFYIDFDIDIYIMYLFVLYYVPKLIPCRRQSM